MKWFVVRTSPKAEFKAQNYYNKLGVSSYLATIESVSSKKKRYEKVVLPSYIFTRLEKLDYKLINSNPFTRDVLKMHGKPAEISEDEINLMRKHLTSSYLNCDFKSVEIGQMYTLPHGVFSGQKGEIISIDSNKIRLLMQSLGMVITITLN